METAQLTDSQLVKDKLDIHELLARYARGVDLKDWDLYRSVFTPDATIDYGADVTSGSRDEVAAWLEKAFADIPWTQHYITNVEVDVQGDRAKVVAMFYNPMHLPGMDEPSSCGGFYHHELVRTADGWKSERLVEQMRWFVNRPGG